MRLVTLKSFLVAGIVVFAAGFFAGCDNPFDPLKSSDKIEGLSHFDFSAAQEHWDTDPEWDGLQITMSYFNEFHNQLNFHDKPHKITIEIWTEKEGPTTTSPKERDTHLATKTIDFSNSDDIIRIPIEYYGGSLDLPSDKAITGFLLVRVFPPKEYPQRELVFPQSGVDLYTPEKASL